MQTENLAIQREAAKAALKSSLKENHGDTKHQAVANAIALLSSLNPTPNPAQQKALLEGKWLLISAPNFPGKLEDSSDRFIYTLGRLAFNKFEPVNLQVALEKVHQPIFALKQENQYSYDIVVEFKIVDASYPEIRGTVKNLAVCSPVDSDIVQVEFTGAELSPSDGLEPKELDRWLAIFGNENLKSQISWLESLKIWLVQKMFGMGKVSAIDPKTGKRFFAINKSPKGKLKLLYLDEELRITQGNRESILVCQREV